MAQDERQAGMANPMSDPETSKDVEDLTKGLEELCESPEEEKSEKALLHSHLEQQHHLICILEKKADDAHQRCRGLEQLNVELEKLRTKDAVKMKTLTQQIHHLEGRFMDLANNHEKMIQFKNEHKKRHMQLWEENKCLQQENGALFSQTVREKEAEVLQLAAQARKLSQQLDSLQEKCAYESCRAQEREKELLEAQSLQASAYAWEVDSLKHQLQHRQEKHQRTAAQVERAESQQRAQGSELQAKLERANEEKERLQSLAMERGRALQDKQREIEQLGRKLEIAENARQRAGKCLVKEAAAAGYDLKVQELQRQLESSKQACSELSLPFDAYRKHSMDLLTKEKALNAKLRHFIGHRGGSAGPQPRSALLRLRPVPPGPSPAAAMRHSLTQLLAASSGGASPSGAVWPLTGAGQAPRGRDGGGEGDPGPARPKQQQPPRREAGALEPRRQEKEPEAPGGPLEVWEQEDWFPGLELGDLLEAARPDWDLDAELSGCFCGDPEPLPPPGQGQRPAAPGRRSGGAGSRLKAAAAARLNRLKKKQYVLGLESRLQGLAAENRQLRDRNRGLSRRLRELERESSYLRAVLANQSALGQLLSRLAGIRAGGLQLSTSLFRDTGSPRRHHHHLQPAGESSDHDYALPSSRHPSLEEAAVVTETEEEWAAPGGICLHVDRDQVSVEFCSICARRAAASFKM